MRRTGEGGLRRDAGHSRPGSDRLRRVWPWLALAVGLGLATMPAWRALAFGVRLSVDDLLQIRCLPW
ncbi:hypothetical protein C0214_22790 [Methylobacterium sp. DM1]|nr:hypothetical protein C0214_22790 [Methylobacterium sp. DM1]